MITFLIIQVLLVVGGLAVLALVVKLAFPFVSRFVALELSYYFAQKDLVIQAKQAEIEASRARSFNSSVVKLDVGQAAFTSDKRLLANHQAVVGGDALTVEVEDTQKITPLDKWWALANKLHTMIVGQTDSGKSYTAKAIIRYRLANGGKAVIIDPHYEAGDWFGLPVVGAKRNFNQIDETFLAVLSEVNKRFDLRANQAGVQFDEVTVVIDEVPAVNANCKHWDKFVSTMSSEARKVNYKLLVLSQSRLVEAFGLKGKSDMRENFSELLLGDFAIKAVKSDKVLAGLLGGLGRGGVLDCVGLHVIDLGGINSFLELELPKNCIQELVSRSVGGNTASKNDTDNLPENWEQISDWLRSGLSANQIYGKLGGNRNEVMGVIRSVKLYMEHHQTGQINGHGVVA